MQFAIPAQAARDAAKLIAKTVPRRSTIPILSHVLIRADADGVALRGTDLDRELTVRLNGAAVAKHGTACVEADLFSNIIAKFPKDAEVKFTLDADKVKLQSGRSRFVLHTLPVEDFPDLGTAQGKQATFTMGAPDLTKLLGTTEFAISDEQTRYYLNGIYLHLRPAGAKRKMMAAVATDGHRLASAEIEVPSGAEDMPSVIVHRETVRLLADVLEGTDTVEATVAETRVTFATAAMTLTSKVIDGTFPEYGRVVPSGNDKLLVAEATALAETADRVSAVSSERGRCVKLDLTPGNVKFSVSNPDAGTSEDTVEAEYAAEPLTIGFNSRYLTDILQHVETDTVDIKFADPGSPALFQPHGDSSSYFVLMPMRV